MEQTTIVNPLKLYAPLLLATTLAAISESCSFVYIGDTGYFAGILDPGVKSVTAVRILEHFSGIQHVQWGGVL